MHDLRSLFVVVAAAASLTMSATVSAEFTGLSTELHTSVSLDGSNYDVWRLYVNFTSPSERFVCGFGSPNVGPMTIETRNFDDSAAGSAFFNFGGPSTNLAPTQALIDVAPAAQWDSFFTIGISIADQAGPLADQTYLTPGFPTLEGTVFSSNNAAWCVTQTIDDDGDPITPEIYAPQALAGFEGDGDSQLRVLIGQFTVQAGDNVRGTLNLQLATDTAPGTVYLLSGVTFNSVPAPSALGFLAGSWILRRSRRRT